MGCQFTSDSQLQLLRWLGQETLEKVPCVWLLVVPVCGGGRELLQMGGEAITDHAYTTWMGSQDSSKCVLANLS